MAAVFMDDAPLFNGQELTTFLANQRARALGSVDSHGWQDFLSPDGQPDPAKEEELLESIAATYRVERLEVDYDAVSRSPLSEIHGLLATTITLPFTGYPELFHLQINHTAPFSEAVRGNVARGESDGEPHRLVFWLRDPDLDTTCDSLLRARQQWLTRMVTFVNRQVDDWNDALEQKLRELISKRAALMAKMRAAEVAIAIPVMKRAEPPIALPVQKRTLQTPSRTGGADKSPRASGDSAWVLEDSAFEEVVRTLVLFAAAAGRLPASAGRLSENDFRNFALLVLNANFYFASARGEVFNGKGKSDLLVPWEAGNALVGEFKKYDGAQTVSDALSQLLDYVTWADTKACLVIIIDRDDVTHALNEMHRAITEHPRHVRLLDSPEPDRLRSYIVSSNRDNDRHVRLATIPIVVDKPKDSSGDEAAPSDEAP